MRYLVCLGALVLVGCAGFDGTPRKPQVPFYERTNAPTKASVTLPSRDSLTLVRPPRCTNNCPPPKAAWTNLLLTADLPGPAQFEWFRLWASTNADMKNEFVFATNRVGVFNVPITKGPQLFTVMAIVDEALPYDSAGRKR